MPDLGMVSGEAAIATEDFWIDSATPGVRLRVRRKHRVDQLAFSGARTLMLAHGATFGLESLFDVPFDGRSFMDVLAEAGFDVYALDVRGFGRSSRPPEMEPGALAQGPSITTEVGAQDLATAVDRVLGRRELVRLNLLGMSWGGSVAGLYATRQGDKIERLGLVAPQWLRTTPSPMDAGGPLPPTRVIDVAKMKERWLAPVPEARRAAVLPDAWFDQWVEATLDSEPDAALRAEGRLRATTGPVLDTRLYWTVGRPIYDPGDIRRPTLLVHGEWDADVSTDQARAYFGQLRNAPERSWLEIGEATHMLLLERYRHLAYCAVIDFFRADGG